MIRALVSLFVVSIDSGSAVVSITGIVVKHYEWLSVVGVGKSLGLVSLFVLRFRFICMVQVTVSSRVCSLYLPKFVFLLKLVHSFRMCL